MEIRDRVRIARPAGSVSAGGAESLVLLLLDEFAAVEDCAELLRVLLLRAVIETRSDRGVISWIDGEEIVVGDWYDPSGDPLPVGSRWPLVGDQVSELGLAMGRMPHGLLNAGSPLDPGSVLRQTYADLGHLLLRPVKAAGDDIALLCVSRRRPEVYDDEDREALDTIARVAAQPLHAARLREQLMGALAELAEHHQRSESLERIKTDVLRLASHELRTPLTVLNGYVSLINDGFFGDMPDGVSSVMAILQRRTADMNLLVNDMLVASRVDEGADAAAAAITDLREVLRDAVDAVSPRASAAHLLRLEMPEHPVLASLDRDRVTMAVRNVVDNAVKYSPQGGEVACALTAGNGEAVIRVTDQGLGIAPEDRGRLFTRFGRILTTENSHIPGIGLGLYFARAVARRHGGDVVLADGCRGTVFEVRLPVLAAESGDAERRAV